MTFKTDIYVEPFVCNCLSRYKRSLLAQLRCGILPLRLETGRFVNVRDDETGRLRKLTVNERLCQICNSNNVENEFHFLFHCDKFKSERENFYSLCIANYSNFVYLCDEDKLNILMNEGNNWRILSNYLVNIWEKRKHIMYKCNVNAFDHTFILFIYICI